MAPELFKDRSNVNPYVADVFSLGLALVYLCTKQKFKTEDRYKHIENPETLETDIYEMI